MKKVLLLFIFLIISTLSFAVEFEAQLGKSAKGAYTFITLDHPVSTLQAESFSGNNVYNASFLVLGGGVLSSSQFEEQKMKLIVYSELNGGTFGIAESSFSGRAGVSTEGGLYLGARYNFSVFLIGGSIGVDSLSKGNERMFGASFGMKVGFY